MLRYEVRIHEELVATTALLADATLIVKSYQNNPEYRNAHITVYDTHALTVRLHVTVSAWPPNVVPLK